MTLRDGSPKLGTMTAEEVPAGPDQRITVYQYGARRQSTGEPSLRMPGRDRTRYPDLSEKAMEQLWLQHQMRNQLVELERGNEEAIAAVWATVPELAELIDSVKVVQTKVDELVETVKKQQSERRGKEKADASLREELKQERAKLKQLKAELRETKDRTYATVEPQLVELRERRKAGIKFIRQQYAELGLYWGTYNSVIDHHNTSVKNIISKRKAGKPAEHRFHRYDRSGTLTVQLQRLAGDPPRSPALLASGLGKWRNTIQIKPYVPPDEWAAMTKAERREIMRAGEITFKVSGDESVTIPVALQRMLPPEADITGVQLSRRRGPDRQHKLSVAVTAKVPATPVRETGPAVALHIGWRVRDDDSIRVGTWVSTEQLEVPEHIQDIVIGHGSWGEIIFPSQWRTDFAFVDSLRSRRDRMLEQIKETIAQFTEAGGVFKVPASRLDPESSDLLPVPRPESGTETDESLEPDALVEIDVTRVKLWRSPARVTILSHALRGTGHELEEMLRDWVRQEKHLWRFEGGRRTRLLNRRKHRYQNAVAWLARTARVIVVDDMDLAELSRSREKDDIRVELARSNRVLAAPGDLRRFMENAAVNHGAAIRKTGTMVSKMTHYACGTVTATPEEYVGQVVLWCDTCGRGFDQDGNAGRLLLAAAGESRAPGQQKRVEPSKEQVV